MNRFAAPGAAALLAMPCAMPAFAQVTAEAVSFDQRVNDVFAG